MEEQMTDPTQETEWLPDRSGFKNAANGYYTESLFLERGYNTDVAMYTFNDDDKEYKGKVYKSLKKLYLETEDPTEYKFATKYLYGWNHWQRIVANGILLKEVEEWREELEVRLRSKGVLHALTLGASSFTAAKWAADGQWIHRKGRKTKEERNREAEMRRKAVTAASVDGQRIAHLLPKKEASQ